MKLFRVLGSIALSIAIPACNSVPKIDGSSDAAFEKSHAGLVQSLSAENRLRLSLAEAIILSPENCLKIKQSPDMPMLNEAFEGQADLRSCRNQLNGLTFEDIMARAYPKGKTSGKPNRVPPN